MAYTTAPSIASMLARNIQGGFPGLGNIYALDGACVGLNSLQGHAATGGSHLVAGSIDATDLASSVLVNIIGGILTDSGTANTYVVTPSPAISAYAAGQVFAVACGTANTGASTLNVNGKGAKAIKRQGGTALYPNDILVNQIILVMYDGTNMQLLSEPGSIGSAYDLLGAYQATDSGSANAYAIATSPPTATLTAGEVVTFKVATLNTGASTLAVDGLTTKNILYNQKPLAAGMLRVGQSVTCIYDGTQWNMVSPPGNAGVGTVFVATAVGTLASFTTAASVAVTGVGSQTLPANTLIIGRRIRFRASGYASSTGTPTYTWAIVMGATGIVTTGTVTTPSGASNLPWQIDLEIDCITTGSTGSVLANGCMLFGSAAQATSVIPFTAVASAVTIDTTATQKVDLTIACSSSSSSNTITCSNMAIEILN